VLISYRSFHEVLDVLLIIYPSFVHLPDLTTPLAGRISNDRRFFPFFKDYISVINSTHITTSVPTKEHSKYRNRKGFLSQNVLAACDFNLYFVYVLSG
jgi:hypothetical protein